MKTHVYCMLHIFLSTIYFSGYTSDKLKGARVRIDHPRDCKKMWSGYITDNMFCAGYNDYTVDTCSGDSGGPLVCDIQGTVYKNEAKARKYRGIFEEHSPEK